MTDPEDVPIWWGGEATHASIVATLTLLAHIRDNDRNAASDAWGRIAAGGPVSEFMACWKWAKLLARAYGVTPETDIGELNLELLPAKMAEHSWMAEFVIAAFREEPHEAGQIFDAARRLPPRTRTNAMLLLAGMASAEQFHSHHADRDVIALHDGRILEVHLPGQCAGDACCIHNPSEHPLNHAPLNWRSDRRIMERICQHGIGHPDPDDVAVRVGNGQGVHGCDGCCRGAKIEERAAP